MNCHYYPSFLESIEFVDEFYFLKSRDPLFSLLLDGIIGY